MTRSTFALPFLLAASLSAQSVQAQSAKDIILGNGTERQIIDGLGNAIGGLFKKKPKDIDTTNLVAVPPLSAADQTKYTPFISMNPTDYAAFTTQCDTAKLSGALKKSCNTAKGYRAWQTARAAVGFDVSPSVITDQYTYVPAGNAAGSSTFDWPAVTPKKGARYMPFLAGQRVLPVINQDGVKTTVDIASLQSMVGSGALSGFKIERVTDAQGSMIGDGNLLRLVAYQRTAAGPQYGSVLFIDKSDFMRVTARVAGFMNWIAATEPKTLRPAAQPTTTGPTIPVRP